jgi:hypothetical protein
VSNLRDFFRHSDLLGALALRQLSHIKGNWELSWDHHLERYEPEEDSFAEKVNDLIDELSGVEPPRRYHDNEDRLAEHVINRLGWNIRKVGTRWVGQDYPCILQQGSFEVTAQKELLMAAAGRIKVAMDRGQRHFDEMEESHRKILADVLAIVLYHRAEV